MKILKYLVAVLLFAASTVWAGDVEDADAALDKKDYATALKKYKSAALKSDAVAQHKLGVMYVEGQGVIQDYAEAVRWFKLAAAQGIVGAQHNLGVMYDNGQGVIQDYAEAVRWFKLAAAQGIGSAQYNLGAMYANGQGVTQNYARSHMWSNLAAAGGNTGAVKNRDIVAAKMTPQQIGEAQKMARECQARDFKKCD